MSLSLLEGREGKLEDQLSVKIAESFMNHKVIMESVHYSYPEKMVQMLMV
jgi:hypothetical protein